MLRLNSIDSEVATLIPESLRRVELPALPHVGKLAALAAASLPWNEVLGGFVDRLREGSGEVFLKTFPTDTALMLWACIMLQDSMTDTAPTR